MSYGTLLFARSGFFGGVVSVLDFNGGLSEMNSCYSAEQADRLALRSDWRAVGHEMRLAVDQLKRQLPGVSIDGQEKTGAPQ